MPSRIAKLLVTAMSGPSDTTAPTCVITCSVSSPSAASPWTFTATFSEDVTGFVIGDFGIANGTKGTFTAVSASVYTLSVTPDAFGNVTATVAAGVCTDAGGNANEEATPLIIFYGVFNPNGLSDGALPAPWTGGATYAIATNKVTNTPTLGSELWDANASTFEGTSTYAWGAYGSNTLANVSNALEITYVNNSNGAYIAFADASDLSANPTLGLFYRLSLSQKINTGAYSPYIDAGGLRAFNFPSLTNTSLETVEADFLCGHASLMTMQVQGMGAGEVVTFDNLSFKSFSASVLLAAVDVGVSNVQVKAGWTLTQRHLGGVAACLNSATAPTYGLFAWTNGAGIYLAKLVNGTWSVLIRNGAYSAGAQVEIRRNGNTVQLYYNNSQVGTDQTVTDVGAGTIHGYFGTTGEAATFTVARFP